MTVTYQAGRRIQGTSTDFGTAGAGIPAVAGGWKEEKEEMEKEEEK